MSLDLLYPFLCVCDTTDMSADLNIQYGFPGINSKKTEVKLTITHLLSYSLPKLLFNPTSSQRIPIIA